MAVARLGRLLRFCRSMGIAQLVNAGALCWAFVIWSDEHTSLWVSCAHCVPGINEAVQVDSLKGVVVWKSERSRAGVDISIIRTESRPDHVAFSVDRSQGERPFWVNYRARPGKSGLPGIRPESRVAYGVLCWSDNRGQAGFCSLFHLPSDEFISSLAKSEPLETDFPLMLPSGVPDPVFLR